MYIYICIHTQRCPISRVTGVCVCVCVCVYEYMSVFMHKTAPLSATCVARLRDPALRHLWRHRRGVILGHIYTSIRTHTYRSMRTHICRREESSPA